MRVQIPAYTDTWMRGDRYGEVIKLIRRRERTIAKVRLDVSGRIGMFLIDDCTVVEG